MRDALKGIRVIDLSINAPGPFASKMLADLGAAVTCVTNPAQAAPAYAGAEDDPMLAARGGPHDALYAGKTSCALDLKSDPGRAALLDLVKAADVLISEMRPGKLDALGLGWEVLRAANPRLVLCEITGYGRKAPNAARAGHDINYLALSGALSLIRDGKADFTYDHQADAYTCPAGKQLRPRQRAQRQSPLADADGMVRYRASKLDCEQCPLKSQCCPKAPARKILRSVFEGARDMARDIATTDAYVASSGARKKVEMLFAHLKRILKLDRLRLRGPNGARDEFHLAATAQNLRKLAKLVPHPQPMPG
jgi:hypothetical protein